jgi:hypothetical protein
MDQNDSSPPQPGTLHATVPTRARHDGWTPDKQHDFIAALAESGCVKDACAAVGMSRESAYKLRARADASVFRQAWDVALDYAIRALSDAALSRAIHGVSRPVFYKGEQIGERRHYDERLTLFLLRYRDPTRYGAWLDKMEARRHPDGAGIVLAHALNSVMDAAHGVPPADGSDGGGDQLGRALSEGPSQPEPEPEPAPEYDGPEEVRYIWEMLRAASDAQEAEEKAARADPADADWRSALPVRRPSIRRI